MTHSLTAVCIACAAGAASADHTQYTNSSVLEWGTDGTSIVYQGPTTLFPSTINVSGTTNPILDVYIVLHEGAHTYADDLEITLRGPNGNVLKVLQDAGGGDDIAGDLRFDDAGAAPMPNGSGFGPFGGGVPYQVSIYGETSTRSTAPTPNITDFSGYDGLSANGDWELYVYDDAGGDTGAFSGGWSIFINTVPAPASAALLGLAGLAGVSRRR